MKKDEIKNLLIISADRWGLDTDSIPKGTQTPARWWTVSESSYEGMPDGAIKNAHMPCCMLFQVGVTDNQGNTCENIEIDTDKKGNITKAVVNYRKAVNFGGSPKWEFVPGQDFTYPYSMKNADSVAAALTDSDANDMEAFIQSIIPISAMGGFKTGAMVVDDEVDANKIGEALNLINSGDLTAAMDLIPAQSKLLKAESSPDYDPSTVDPTATPATPSGYEPAEMAAEDANIAPLDGPQGVGSGSPTAIGEGHGVTESFGKSTAPVPGTLFSADGSIEDSYECSKCSTHFEDEDSAENCCTACYNCGYADHVGFARGQKCCPCDCDETGGDENGMTCRDLFGAEDTDFYGCSQCSTHFQDEDSADECCTACYNCGYAEKVGFERGQECCPCDCDETGGDENGMTCRDLFGAEGEDPSAAGGPGPSPLDAPATPSDYEINDLDARIDAWMAETATHDPYSDEVPYEGPGEFSGSEVTFDAEKSAIGKTQRPGALTRKAKRAGMTTRAFARHVLANPSRYPKLTRQQAQYYVNILEPGSATSAKRSRVRADYRRKGYMLAESQVTWEDDAGVSSPSAPPEGVFMADEVDEIYGTGHIIGQTGSTWTTSPLAAEDEYASGYGENSAWPSSQGVPQWYGSAEDFGAETWKPKPECEECGAFEGGTIDGCDHCNFTYWFNGKVYHPDSIKHIGAETFCADCGEYDAECGCYASESFNLPVVGTVGTKSAVVGIGLGVGLMALLARFKK